MRTPKLSSSGPVLLVNCGRLCLGRAGHSRLGSIAIFWLRIAKGGGCWSFGLESGAVDLWLESSWQHAHKSAPPGCFNEHGARIQGVIESILGRNWQRFEVINEPSKPPTHTPPHPRQGQAPENLYLRSIWGVALGVLQGLKVQPCSKGPQQEAKKVYSSPVGLGAHHRWAMKNHR